MSVGSEKVVNLNCTVHIVVLFQQISLVTIVEIQTKKAKLRLKLYTIVVGSSGGA